jgi:hypothetical protein
MLLSCLAVVSNRRRCSVLVHTLVEERLCTGSQNGSLCKTGRVELHRISAYVRDNGCMLGLPAPAFSAWLLVLVPHIGPYKETELHKGLADYTAVPEAVARESPDQWNVVG